MSINVIGSFKTELLEALSNVMAQAVITLLGYIDE